MAYDGSNYYHNTADLALTGLFRASVDTSNLERTQSAFGYALTLLEGGQIDVARLNIVGDNAKKYAQQLLEAQTQHPTGTLKDSIDYSIVKDNGRHRLELYASALNTWGVPYGTFVEYGSHPHGGRTYVSPKPFLRPALEFARENTRDNIQNTLNDIFKNITRDYDYADLFFKSGHATRFNSVRRRTLGNRALATKSSVRNTANNKPYGRPTRTGLNKLAKEMTSHYQEAQYRRDNSGTRYSGVSRSIKNSKKTGYYGGG